MKHWAGFPSKAIAYCLREAGLALSDVQYVAVNQDSRANFLRKLAYADATREAGAKLGGPGASEGDACAGRSRAGVRARKKNISEVTRWPLCSGDTEIMVRRVTLLMVRSQSFPYPPVQFTPRAARRGRSGVRL